MSKAIHPLMFIGFAVDDVIAKLFEPPLFALGTDCQL